MKKAFITGITGQDGSYLSELLLERGYEVHGLVRPDASRERENPFWRIEPFREKLNLHSGSVEDYRAMVKVMEEVKPDECYHLAAQTFVPQSSDDEMATMNANVNGALNILSAAKQAGHPCRIFFPGSAEMFGRTNISPQNEETPFHPRSIYGVSKTCGFELVRHYRETHAMFAVTGILYNHESPRRDTRFVTRKITSSAARIKLGLAREIRLGNIETLRDWGFAGDTVKAMHMMLQADSPEDYVIATGKTHSVKDFLKTAFGELDLDYKKYLALDPEFFRESEACTLVGDSSKAKSRLQWEPETSFTEMVKSMALSDLKLFKKT